MNNKKHTEETKKKISASRKGKCLGKDNPMYGKTHTLEIRQRISEAQKGEKGHRWKPIGSETITKDGIKVKTKNGFIFKHRLIAEKILGRKLKFDEVVHHINKNNLNNKNSNLLICTAGYHNSLHRKMEKLKKIEQKGVQNAI